MDDSLIALFDFEQNQDRVCIVYGKALSLGFI
jgi:hypothetical protein